MMMDEFLERANIKSISDEDWDLINHVYTWHPQISNVSGKDQVAWLYKNFGISIFRDMKNTADKAQELNTKLQHLESEKRKLLEELESL